MLKTLGSVLSAVGIFAIFFMGLNFSEGVEPDEEPELAAYMSTMQYYTAKLDYSIQAENKELADFYLHELEEALEKIEEDVTTYEGYEIAELSEKLLMPQIEQLEVVMGTEQWSKIDRKFELLINSCNKCHSNTDHAFINIARAPESSPYNQDFSPQN